MRIVNVYFDSELCGKIMETDTGYEFYKLQDKFIDMINQSLIPSEKKNEFILQMLNRIALLT